MKYLPTYLMCLMYAAGELWRLGSLRVSNWFIAYYWPLTEEWNIKYASGELQWLIVSLMVFTYPSRRYKANSVSIMVFIFWCCVNVWLHFYNFKTQNYEYVYLWLSLAWVLLYFWKGKTADKLWEFLHTIATK